MRNTPALIVLTVIIASILGGMWLYFRGDGALLQQTSLPVVTPSPASPSLTVQGGQFTFSDPKKSAHYESNTPSHGAVLPGAPVAVVVDFNFDLANGSTISVSREGKDYGVGPTVIDENRLALRRDMDIEAPDGVYTVIYRACWPDRTCHDGFFQFAIDRAMAANLTDWTNQPEVTVDMKDIAFAPLAIRISRGTTVAWTNQDTLDHYVNTDSHPAHTQHLSLNSKLLKPGDSYSYTFDKPGLYGYHCSAHAGAMSGMILVE